MCLSSSRKRAALTLEESSILLLCLKVGNLRDLLQSLMPPIYGNNARKLSATCCWVAALLYPRNVALLGKVSWRNLDKACFMWFMQQRSKGPAVTGSLLQGKASQFFYNSLSNFECSNLLKMALDGFSSHFGTQHFWSYRQFWTPFGPTLPR